MFGGRISDIGIKGGTNVAWYDYGDTSNLWVAADGYGSGSSASAGTLSSTGTVNGLTVDDTKSTNVIGDASYTGLHAPRDNQGNLYSISQLTICYEPSVKISGYVYRDSNGSGAKDTGETGLGDRSVTLGGSTVTSSQGGTGNPPLGYYEAIVPAGTYTLCSSANTGEVQTQPLPSTACGGIGGWGPTNYTSDTPDQNFGFAGGVPGSCASSSNTDPLESSLESVGATVIAKFLRVDSNCKVDGKDLVFTTYQDGNSLVAQLSPVGSLGTATCDSTSTTTAAGCQIVAQKITWSIPGPSPDTSVLQYDDPPYGTKSPMKFCNKDPRDTSASDGVTLLPVSTSGGYYPGSILPSGETSCLIEEIQGPKVPGATPTLTRVDYVYSAYDGKIYSS
jgi:hypothetical protein